MGIYSSALNADVEDFKSLISTLENTQRTLIEHHSPESTQTFNHATAEEQTGPDSNEVKQEPDLLALKFLFTNTDTPNAITEPVQNCTSALKPVEISPSLSSLISVALSGSLPVKSRPAPQGPITMEQMTVQLGELRNELDLLKAQHKKEITLLMNELDEEKKMRLSLQIDVERLKKRMSK
ncbi:SH3 domain-containing kinase-binding protein 1 [Triplophysa rosa]|uniref:SH3 domain-containing kinase-binding protein 1-like n=1 Tax=Triplophysa rosa TaxID=992332 RepID=A0A9W7TG47_TRIRA|nr:SH3 domain-containing kinase-binding protein 1 [Triplophysa rosa]KAI7795848.1 putative SH3 domain-containing kinase-binding protein 1-like [Triplophysa rosa]